MLFHKYLAKLDQLDSQLLSASIQPRTKLDYLAATAKGLAAHIDQIYQFNENRKINCKANLKDDQEIMLLSHLNLVVEVVNIPVATSQRITSMAKKNQKFRHSPPNSSSGDTGLQPDDLDVNQAPPRSYLRLSEIPRFRYF
jgi:hypothetical protein